MKLGMLVCAAQCLGDGGYVVISCPDHLVPEDYFLGRTYLSDGQAHG